MPVQVHPSTYACITCGGNVTLAKICGWDACPQVVVHVAFTPLEIFSRGANTSSSSFTVKRTFSSFGFYSKAWLSFRTTISMRKTCICSIACSQLLSKCISFGLFLNAGMLYTACTGSVGAQIELFGFRMYSLVHGRLHLVFAFLATRSQMHAHTITIAEPERARLRCACPTIIMLISSIPCCVHFWSCMPRF